MQMKIAEAAAGRLAETAAKTANQTPMVKEGPLLPLPIRIGAEELQEEALAMAAVLMVPVLVLVLVLALLLPIEEVLGVLEAKF